MLRSNLGLNVQVNQCKSRHRSIVRGAFSVVEGPTPDMPSSLEIASWRYYSIERGFSFGPAAHIAMIVRFLGLELQGVDDAK